MDFRLNQRVCKVDWRDCEPYLRVGVVTKVTRSTYYVDDAKKASTHWRAKWQDAIDDEYRSLFMVWGIMHGHTFRPDDWTIEDTVRCTCKVRRLERRIKRRRIRKVVGMARAR